MNLTAFFSSFQCEERVVRINKSEITGEHVFNGQFLEIEDNHESSKDEITWFYIFFQICYPFFNP